jgi:6-phosphogluconolactonase
LVAADVDAVGKKLCGIVEEAAKKAIQEKGSFSLAIPGGSILKMLKGLNGKSSIQWDKAVMAYVRTRAPPTSLRAARPRHPGNATSQAPAPSGEARGQVNHRCVPLDDETSTHFKARPLFLDSWMEQGLNVLTLGGSTDAPKEADAYAAAMQARPAPPAAASCTLLRVAPGTP